MSAADTASFERFSYLIRPSKQVERKIMIEVLSRLRLAAYDVSEYKYVGFGSPYYVDFIMFHRYLYIREMACIELRAIPKRMDFNKPYEFITLHMMPAADFGPHIHREKRAFVWLDYDYILDRSVLDDVALFVSLLPAGSIIAVTVNAEPRRLDAGEDVTEAARRRAEEYIGKFREEFGHVYPREVTRGDVQRPGLPNYFANVLRAQIRTELARRTDGVAGFLQLFNYRYADGRQMLTLGGMIETPQKQSALSSSGILAMDFVVSDEATPPLELSVPPLTLREKHWLDCHLAGVLTDEAKAFEIEDEPIANFRRFYRHYPTYFETLI